MTTNFDRAASFYDDTRGLPEATMAALIDRLADGLGRAEEVLELGVGTGRVAVPLSERGYAMTGIDVSEKMLAVLDTKSSAVEAQVADASDLPFGDASFDAVLAVDFFHLVCEWRRAVEEAVRVLRQGNRIKTQWSESCLNEFSSASPGTASCGSLVVFAEDSPWLQIRLQFLHTFNT